MLVHDLENLADIDVYDVDFLRDPHSAYTEAKKQGWIAKCNFGYVLLDYQAMQEFIKDDRCRTPNRDITAMSGMPEDSPFVRFNNGMLLALEGESHDRLRNIIAPAFTPRDAARYRDFMRETIDSIVDQVAEQGECDFVRIAAQYPITVMCKILGVAAEDIAIFEAWLDKTSEGFSQTEQAIREVDEALGHMYNYVDDLIQQRRKPGEKPDDLLQKLVDLAEDGAKMSDEELRATLINLFAGGYDTTKNQLILCMKALVDNPEQWQNLADNPDRVKAFIDETLRFYNPIQATFRLPNEDFEYRDIVFPKDTMVMVPLTFAGRDETVNECPMNFDPDRAKKNHMAFGYGRHICVGMWLAKALLEEGLPIIARRLRKPKPAGEAVPRPFSAVFGFAELPISFEPEKPLRA